MSRTAAEVEATRPRRTLNERCLAAIEWYQEAFSFRPSPCRFSPSCSHYAHEAFTTHGTARGFWLTLRRLSHCRPFGPSGWDPVPEPTDDSPGRK
jgi:putative membrane protein insertion efficiency factor